MISVLILTKNEELDIVECLDSLHWCGDIQVLDSGSSDRTVEIAMAAGANVVFSKFESFGQQRNFALDKMSFKHEWILFLDADERVTPDFFNAISDAVKKTDDSFAGFYCCWKMILEDVWLKRCDNFPKWQFRLMRKGRARFTDYGHGQKEAEVNGKIGYIKEPYLHFGFSKGWSHWLDRHNRYAGLEAIARLENVPPFTNIFSRHQSMRNPALKAWLIKLPGWPLLRFMQAYLLNLGLLEGAPGFNYCVNMAYYEFLIKIKMREIKILRSRKMKIKN